MCICEAGTRTLGCKNLYISSNRWGKRGQMAYGDGDCNHKRLGYSGINLTHVQNIKTMVRGDVLKFDGEYQMRVSRDEYDPDHDTLVYPGLVLFTQWRLIP